MSSTIKSKALSNGSGHEPPDSRGIVILLSAIVVVSVLIFGAVDSATLTLLAVMFFAIVVLWFWSAFADGMCWLNTNALQFPLLVLFLIGIIQLLPLGSTHIPPGLLSVPAVNTLSLEPYATRFFLARLFLYILFFAAGLTYINTFAKLRTTTLLLITFGGVLAFYSILQRVETPSAIYGIREPGQAIPFGTYVNRHHFAALMEMTLGLTLGVLFAGGLKKNRWPFLIAAASVMSIAIVLTGSRGGMIGFVALLAIVAAATIFSRPVDQGSSGSSELSRRSTRLAVIAGGSAFFLLTVGLTLFLGGADPLLRSAGIDPGAGDFSSGRLQFWQTAWKIFLDHPIIGAGLDAFGTAYSQYDVSNGAFRVEQAHNDYLQILSDAGILGFACVAAFIVLFFRQGLRTIRDAHDNFRRGAAIGAFAGCFGILIHSFFDFPLRTPANGFVFLAMVIIAVAEVDRSSVRRSARRRSSS